MKVFLSLVLFATAVFAEPINYNYQPQQQKQQQQQQLNQQQQYQQQQKSQGQRYFFARQQQAPEASAAPYPPSSWKPDGPAFTLPEPQQRQNQAVEVKNSYGAPQEPQQQQETPNNQYIPPQAKSALGGQQSSSALRPQQYNRFEAQSQARAPRPHEQYNAPQSQYGAPDFTTTDFPESTEYDEATTVGGLPELEPEQLDSHGEFDEEVNNAGQVRYLPPQQQEHGQYYVALPDGRLQRVRYVSRQDLEAMRYFAKIRAENVEPLRGPIYAYMPLQKLEATPGTLQVSPVSSALVSGVTRGLTVTAVEGKPQKLVAPKVDIKPLAQLQYQHDNQAQLSPVNSKYTAYASEYQAPASVPEERYILAFQ